MLALAAVTVVLAAGHDARAHTRVVHVLPAYRAFVDRPPDRVRVRFSKPVDGRVTKISLVGPRGTSSLVIEGSGADPFEELSIPVPDQGNGGYVVRWDIIASEGERLRGRARFVVEKSSARVP
jgi:methionine-rich copper-binding protein CopC